jgi:putative transposase|tara:strand:+ start:8378 stop:8542 length:165 start_codon:yes stop_codon:yes gene_type:complete
LKKRNSFRYFKTPPEIIRLAVMMYVRFPLPFHNVKDFLHEGGFNSFHEAAWESK